MRAIKKKPGKKLRKPKTKFTRGQSLKPPLGASENPRVIEGINGVNIPKPLLGDIVLAECEKRGLVPDAVLAVMVLDSQDEPESRMVVFLLTDNVCWQGIIPSHEPFDAVPIVDALCESIARFAGIA